MKIIDFLQCCPNSVLLLKNDYLICKKCFKKYPFVKKNFLDMSSRDLPKWFYRIDNKNFISSYKKILLEKDEKQKVWGGEEDLNSSTKFFYEILYKEILNFLKTDLSKESDFLIDISSGGGFLTSKFIKNFPMVIFCEAHFSSIMYSYKMYAISEKIFYLKTHYLTLPFKDGSVRFLICLDTLERGFEHELNVLKEINRVLAKNGKAVVDFHYRHFGGFQEIFFYSKEEIDKILKMAGFSNFIIKSIGFYPARLPMINSFFLYKIINFISRLFLKPIRYLALIKK